LTNCGGLCVDLQADPLHCSACGLACADDEACSGGLCVPIGGGGGCKTGLTPCGPTCADVQTDADNCGACGAACPAGEACVDGECAPSTTAAQTAGCPEGQVLCGEACRNALTTADGGVYCSGGGSPPTACPPGQSLCNGACYADGACQPTDCPPGWGRCYGICKDFATDPGYCGGCSIACPGAICSGGQCVNCPAGQTPCGAACVDTATDLNNCGFCGNLCGTLCIDGQCTAVGPSPLNCGNLGESCANRPCCSGTTCASGVCYAAAGDGEFPCGISQGFAHCGSYGICVDTRTDRNFCGGCAGDGIRCGEGSECRGGICTVPSTAASAVQSLAPTAIEPVAEPEPVAIEPEPEPEPAAIAPEPEPEPEPPAFSCPEGQADCGGICTDVSFDPLNCGGCGIVCESGGMCDFGVCGAAPAAPDAPEGGDAACVDTGGACDPASPGACCSGTCNDDGACA
jgi:hypothetical protein